MGIAVLGVDLGKTVCSLAGVNEAGAAVFRKRLHVNGASTNRLQGKAIHTWFATMGRFSAWIKLLSAPADRVGLRPFSAFGPPPEACRQGRSRGVGGCRTRSTFRRPFSLPFRFPRHADRRVRISGFAGAVRRRCSSRNRPLPSIHCRQAFAGNRREGDARAGASQPVGPRKDRNCEL